MTLTSKWFLLTPLFALVSLPGCKDEPFPEACFANQSTVSAPSRGLELRFGLTAAPELEKVIFLGAADYDAPLAEPAEGETGASVQILSESGRVLGTQKIPFVWGRLTGLGSMLNPDEARSFEELVGLSEFRIQMAVEQDASPRRVRLLRERAAPADEGETLSRSLAPESIEFELGEIQSASKAEAEDEDFSDTTVSKLHYSGDARNRVNFVILSDGYLAADMPEFRAKVARLRDEILGRHPFSKYKDAFNLWSIEAPSEEQGVSCEDGTARMRKNRFGTVFPIACINAKFHKNYNDRFIHQWRAGRIYQAAGLIREKGHRVPTEVFVLAKSEKWGGSAIIWASMTDRTSDEVFTHELGHSFGGLADEYIVPGDPCNIFGVFSPNIDTKHSNAKRVKWKNWLEPSTPIPTPEEESFKNVVGLFKGGADCPNLYRPRKTCKMKTNGGAYCEVCNEQIIHKLYAHARPIQSKINISGDQDLVATAQIGGPELIAQWWLDGKPATEPGPYAPWIGKRDTKRHALELRAWDPTAEVRADRCKLAGVARARLPESLKGESQ